MCGVSWELSTNNDTNSPQQLITTNHASSYTIYSSDRLRIWSRSLHLSSKHFIHTFIYTSNPHFLFLCSLSFFFFFLLTIKYLLQTVTTANNALVFSKSWRTSTTIATDTESRLSKPRFVHVSSIPQIPNYPNHISLNHFIIFIARITR